MTAAPLELLAEPFDVIEPTALDELTRTVRTYGIEMVATFGLLLTVGVALCVAKTFAALGIGTGLYAMVYLCGHRADVHCNPAITLAALLWQRIPMRGAAGYWCAQLAAGVCAAIVCRVLVAPDQMQTATMTMMGGRTLVAALAAELSFAFILSWVVFRCISGQGLPSNKLAHWAIGIAVVAGAVDLAAVLGDVYLVSQVIVGAVAGIAFLAFGSADR
jgi:aquaporin Z